MIGNHMKENWENSMTNIYNSWENMACYETI